MAIEVYGFVLSADTIEALLGLALAILTYLFVLARKYIKNADGAGDTLLEVANFIYGLAKARYSANIKNAEKFKVLDALMLKLEASWNDSKQGQDDTQAILEEMKKVIETLE